MCTTKGVLDKTIILAGGFGKRAELSNSKSLIKTSDGKTILEHIIDDLNTSGIKKVTIVSNSLHHSEISDTLAKIDPKVKIDLFENCVTKKEDALGALDDLLLAYDHINASQGINFLVLPCDTTYWNEFSISDFLEFVESKGNVFSTVACDVGDKKEIENRFGCLEIDENGKLISFEEKPKKAKSLFKSVPVYFFRYQDIVMLETYKEVGGELDSPGSFIPFLLKNDVEVAVYITGSNVIDAGVPGDIKRAEQY